MGFCKFCEKDKKLIKAHIIPEAFYKKIPIKSNDITRIYTNTDGEYPKKAPIGIYDESLLCAECELKFKEIDDYAINFFVFEKFNSRPFDQKNRDAATIVSGSNNELLNLFFVSLLWRSSASDSKFFKSVRLGPLELLAKEILLKKRVPENNKFETFIWEFYGKFPPTIMDPVKNKLNGINVYRFFLGKYGLIIKADHRSYNNYIENFIVQNRQDITIIKRNIQDTGEFNTMIDIAKKTEKILKKSYEQKNSSGQSSD